jgi:dTDP-4-dehydrorhamnose 3,5-epimerase
MGYKINGKNINGIVLTPLSIISTKGGDILHAFKSSEQTFSKFGEAYFSNIKLGFVKAWKRHREMTLNLVVPIGEVKFVIFDGRKESSTYNQFQTIILSKDKKYYRLTIPKMVWVGFQGIGENDSMILNIASVEHSEDEVERKEVNEIKFNWKV